MFLQRDGANDLRTGNHMHFPRGCGRWGEKKTDKAFQTSTFGGPNGILLKIGFY